MDTLELLVAYIEREDARYDNTWRVEEKWPGHIRELQNRHITASNTYCTALSAAGGGYYWNIGERSF